MGEIHLYGLGFIALFSAIMVLWQRDTRASALALAMSFLAQAGLFWLLDARLAAILQILLFGSALLMASLGVRKLLPWPIPGLDKARYRPWKFIGGACMSLGAGFILITLIQSQPQVDFAIKGHLTLSILLFAIGAVGVMVRRNGLMALMSLSLMLTAANLSFLAISQAQGHGNALGPMLFVMALALAHGAVGFILLIALFKHRSTVQVDEAKTLKG